MTKDTRVHIFVSGKVQGVYYRQNTLQKAQELGIFGWVRNLSDGRVESVMEGSRSDIDKVLAWCKEGPLGAKVEEVKFIDEPYKNEFSTFDIIKSL